MGLGAVNVKAQVRIGGNAAPDASAVLDLNADGTNSGTKGLALPRVSLSSNTAQLTSGVPNLTGMLVYNTTATPGVGVYYWDGSMWVNVGSFVEVDGVIGNEVLNATANRGLVRAGSGTTASPYTLGIAGGGVDSSMLKALTPISGLNTLAYVNGSWRQVTYERVYAKTYLPTSTSTWIDTLTYTGCLTVPEPRLLSSGGNVVSWTWLTGPANMLYVRPLTSGQPVYVYMYCWIQTY